VDSGQTIVVFGSAQKVMGDRGTHINLNNMVSNTDMFQSWKSSTIAGVRRLN